MASLNRLETALASERIRHWANYASKSSTEGSQSPVRRDMVNLLRTKANSLRKTQDQRNPLNTYTVLWGSDSTTPKYIRDHIEGSVQSLIAEHISELSPAQRELLALYALTVHPSEYPFERFKPTMQLHKFVNRLHNSHIYQTQEDWLTSASMVVQIEGRSIQDELKDIAKRKIDKYLARSVVDTKGKRILPNLYDFAAMSDIVIDTVYVHNQKKPLFLNHPTFYDFDKLIAHNLQLAPDFIRKHFPFSDHNKEKRERTMEDFFAEQYPKLFYSSRRLPELLAETFAIYMTIHPMTDGNGTMIHSLIDHALQARGDLPIPGWNKVKLEKPLIELRQWIQGNVHPLEKWFNDQLEISRTSPK